MLVLKGDIVRTGSGLSGEITEIWGVARPWAKLKQGDGKSAFILRTDVTEVIKRLPTKRGKR